MAAEMFTVESTLSPSDAFARLIDLARAPEWDPGISESRLIDGTAATVGARYELGLTGFDGQPTSAVYELTSVEDNRTFTMVGTNSDFRAEDTLTVEATDHGCRLTYEGGLVLLGDQPPVDETQLTKIFAKVVAVVETGLAAFLTP